MTTEQLNREIINLEFSDLVKIENTIKTLKNGFFKIGAKVSFVTRRDGSKVFGTIDKINPKSIGVKVEDGPGWKVSKSLLRLEV